MEYDVIVLGAGLSGLQTAYILSKEGMRVAVLDKNPRIGGMIQSFARKGVVFNTGFNYAESLGEGEVLNRYFSYLDVMDKVSFKRLDEDCFEEIHLGDKKYPIAQGEENFIETLSQYFPQERENIKRYMSEMGKMINQLPHYNLDHFTDLNKGLDYYSQESAVDFLNKMTSNTTLQNIFTGNSIIYAAQKEKLPAYMLSLINYSFINSAWRIEGGGYSLAVALRKGIERNGGELFRRKEVSELLVKNGSVNQVVCKDGERFTAKKIISSIHPQQTLQFIDASELRPVYRNRIMNLENSVGMFSVYIILKKKVIPFVNRNYHVFKTENTWCANYKNWGGNYMLYMTEDANNKGYAESVTILTYMKYTEVEEWVNTKVERRGDRYKAFKEQKAQTLLDFVANKFPAIKNNIQHCYTSTPLTYRDYTGSVNGSAYGIVKDFRYPLKTMVLPGTRLKNLFFTGQNLNVHGILGTTISSFMVSSLMLGQDYLMNKVIKP